MRTKSLLVVVIGIFFVIHSSYAQTSSSGTGTIIEQSYKAIVKINTYTLGGDNDLVEYSSGSGIIIDKSGIVITNSHVVTVTDDFGAERPTAYQVCISRSINTAPSCVYVGKLISKDSSLDLALLKISPFPGLTNDTDFTSLTLTSMDTTSVGNTIYALGFPSIGSETITSTQGTVSGKLSKYNVDWIKTDAVTSYGNSGGAAIDELGRVIGITTSAHKDLLGELGYIISSSSAYPWVIDHLDAEPHTSPLESRLADLTQFQINSQMTDELANPTLPFSITKPSNFHAEIKGESFIKLQNQSNDNGGFMYIGYWRTPYVYSRDSLIPAFRRSLVDSGTLLLFSIASSQDITINGVPGKKVILRMMDKTSPTYLFAAQDYMISIMTYNGSNDMDQNAIEAAVQTFKTNNILASAVEKHSYTNANPVFSIQTSADWPLTVKSTAERPLIIESKTIKDASVIVNVHETDATLQKQGNAGLLEYYKKYISDVSRLSSSLGVKVELIRSSAHANLNSVFKDVVMLEYSIKNNSNNAIIMQELLYFIPRGNRHIELDLQVPSNDKALFQKAKIAVNDMLKGLTITSAAPSTVAAKDKIIKNTKLYTKLKGKFITLVQSKGETYYISPTAKKAIYIGKITDAYAIIKKQAVGISTADLEKIPLSLSGLTGTDTDADGLPDAFETAIGTNPALADTDGDGFADLDELKNGYSPLKPNVKLSNNAAFTAKQQGRLLLAVRMHGEVWYVNPKDGKRYLLPSDANLSSILKQIIVGISNKDFASL